METIKKRIKNSPNLGHTREGGEAKLESGHTFLRFFLNHSLSTSTRIPFSRTRTSAMNSFPAYGSVQKVSFPALGSVQ